MQSTPIAQTCNFLTPANTFAGTECDVAPIWSNNREPKYLTRIIILIPNQWMWRFALVATANDCSFAFDVFSCARFFPHRNGLCQWLWSWLMAIYEVSFAHIEMGICQRSWWNASRELTNACYLSLIPFEFHAYSIYFSFLWVALGNGTCTILPRW